MRTDISRHSISNTVGQWLHVSIVVCFLINVIVARAQVPVLTGGAGPLTFDSTPAPAEFSTRVLTGSATTFGTAVALDSAVQSLYATNINAPLSTNNVLPPSTFSGGFRHNTSGLYLQTRPTTDVTNAANVLMATFRNESGTNIDSFTISYDFGINNPLSGEIPGFRVFFSLAGIPGSWRPLPTLSGTEIPGRHSATLPLGFWPTNSVLFLVWADDNANSITDPSYTIDNLSVTSVIAATVSCIAIASHPASSTVNERGNVTFTVNATGYPQYIQWYRDDVTVPGANGTNYTVSSVAYPNDTGARFHAVITNSLCNVTSSMAVLTVVPDMVAPTVISAVGGLDLDTLTVTFSEAIAATINEGSFTLFPTGGDPDGPEALLAYSVVLTNNNTAAIVTTDPRSMGANYSLRVGQVLDASSQQNFLSPDPTIVPFIAQDVVLIAADGTKEFRVYQDGSRDNTRWQGLLFDDSNWASGSNVFSQFPAEASPPPGFVIADTTLNPTVSGGPNTVYFRTHFQLDAIPTNATFHLSHWIDDGGVFYVNGSEAGRVRMPSGSVSFATAAGSPAEPHPAEELLLEPSLFAAGDNLLAIEVHQTNSTSTDIAMGIRLLARLGRFEFGPAAIVEQPHGLTVDEGNPAAFSVTVAGAQPIGYRWYKDGAEINGANGAILSLLSAAPGSAGNYSVIASNSFNSATSAVAHLTVIPDTISPIFLAAQGDTDLTNITLQFSERLDSGNAQLPAHYQVRSISSSSQLVIHSATVVDATNVLLTTSARTPGESYKVFLNGVTDAAEARNPAMPGSKPLRCATMILAPDATTVWRFNQTGTDLAAAGWQDVAYDDTQAGWSSGIAGLSSVGEETSAGFELRTFTLNPQTNGGPITTYFRTHFHFPGRTNRAVLKWAGVIDDGAAFYVNGVIAGRIRLTNSPIAFGDQASVTALEVTNVFHQAEGPFELTAHNLMPQGDNVLAVEVHQQGTNSSDIVLSLQLIAEIEDFGDGTRLTISPAAAPAQFEIRWYGDGILEEATSVENGKLIWTDVPGNPASPYPIGSTGPSRFFRVKR